MLIAPYNGKTNLGDFNVKVENDKLLVPQDVYTLLNKVGVKEAESFICYVDTYPSYFAVFSNWDISEVKQAAGKLVQSLDGLINEEILRLIGEPRIQYAFGTVPLESKK